MNVQFTYKRKVKMVNRGRWRRPNVPIFNTVCLAREVTGQQASASTSLVTSSEVSVAPNHIRVLGSASRNSSSSRSAGPIFRTPQTAPDQLNLQGFKPTSKDPDINDPLLREAFRSPEVPSSSSVKNHASNLSKSIRSLPQPSFIQKRRLLSTGSSPWPKSSSSSRTPRTPRTPFSNTADSNPQLVIAVTEGRGVATGEVGLAAMDANRPHLLLCQVSDTQTYVNSLTKINVMQPVEILVPNTIAAAQPENRLFGLLKNKFPQASIKTVQRVHFNNATGLQKIKSFCLPEYAGNLIFLQQKFYALSAAAALLKYLEFQKNILFTHNSLKIEYQSPENIMYIDLPTAQRLELVMAQAGGERPVSLFDVLNHCVTLSGKRLLRANILQPPMSAETIDSRLLSVSELTQNPALLHMVKTALEKFKDVEKLLWLSVQLKHVGDEQQASSLDRQTNYVLLLKTSLENLGTLRDSLKEAQTPFFRKVLKDLDDERFPLLLTTILEVVNQDSHSAHSFKASQFQRCFAVKPKINGLLDVTRSCYSSLVSEMHDKVQEMAEEFSLPLKTNHTANKGFHIQINVTNNSRFSAKDLPPVLIQVNRTKNVITCTTEDLAVMNQRMKSLMWDAQIMSNALIVELVQRLRTNMGCLYKLCEDVAELDMLASLAQVSSDDKFVHPTFGENMQVKNSKHPILDYISRTPVTPNDVCGNRSKNVRIITGPNMGGKSVYLKQVALLQIMAQIGCFVPAEKAEFRITDKIFTRMGLDESIELKASSFQLEMREMKYILKNVTNKSIVIVDELCRSTASEEGTAVALVICEQLLQFQAYSFIATHFLGLTKLQSWHPNVANYHMEASPNAQGRLIYSYRLCPGVTKLMKYGLTLAKLAGFPQNLLDRANQICNDLEEEILPVPKHDDVKTEEELIEEIYQEMVDMMEADKWNVEEVAKMQEKWRPILAVFLDESQEDHEGVGENASNQNVSNTAGTVHNANMNAEVLNSIPLSFTKNVNSVVTTPSTNIAVESSLRCDVSPLRHEVSINAESVIPHEVSRNNLSQQTCNEITAGERTPHVSDTRDSTEINRYHITEILTPKNRPILAPGSRTSSTVARSPVYSPSSLNEPAAGRPAVKNCLTPQLLRNDQRTLSAPEFSLREHMGLSRQASSVPSHVTLSQNNSGANEKGLLNENRLGGRRLCSVFEADNSNQINPNWSQTSPNPIKLFHKLPTNLSYIFEEATSSKCNIHDHNQTQHFSPKSSSGTYIPSVTSVGRSGKLKSKLSSSTPTRCQMSEGQNDYSGFEPVMSHSEMPPPKQKHLSYTSNCRMSGGCQSVATQNKRDENEEILLKENWPRGLRHSIFDSVNFNQTTQKHSQELFGFPQDVSPIGSPSSKLGDPAHFKREHLTPISSSGPYEHSMASKRMNVFFQSNMPSCSTPIQFTEEQCEDLGALPVMNHYQMRTPFQMSLPSTSTGRMLGYGYQNQMSDSQCSSTPMVVDLTPNLNRLPRYALERLESEGEERNAFDKEEE